MRRRSIAGDCSSPGPGPRPSARLRPVAATGLLALALGATACSDRELFEEGSLRLYEVKTMVSVSSNDRLDLLFVLDNSLGMADKHRLLAEALPDFFARLLAVSCEDPESGDLTVSDDGDCPAGWSPRSTMFSDVHVGVITSSLGGHGGIACSPAEGSTFSPEKDDRGELVAPLRGIATPDDQGFVAWSGHPWRDGARDLAPLVADVTEIVEAVGERGCGYEAPLEAMVRFLVDPMPPTRVVNEGARSVVEGLNTTLLEQRARFLRPASIVGIVLLPDEDACSVRDDGPGFLVAGGGKLPRGPASCATDPTERCCRSCALLEDEPPEGCAALADDPGCQLGPFTAAEEHASLRCYEQKRRFGIDFLHPTWRYVDALQNPLVYGRACVTDADCPGSPQQPHGGRCTEVGGGATYCQYDNPLMSDNAYYPHLVPRSGSDLVFLTGIVGVPWQDVATAESLTDPNDLEFLGSWGPGGESLSTRWDTILGSDATGGYPLAPFMWESVEPRYGVHALSGLPLPPSNPLTGDKPAPPGSENGTSAINGHEMDVTDGGLLQYACTYPLVEPRDCTSAVTGACECKEADSNLATKPLCQAPGEAVAGITQRFGKAHPSPRVLQVLRDYGLNASVASACPKLTAEEAREAPAYGYRAALASLFGRSFDHRWRGSGGTCFPAPLPLREDGSLPCVLVEITHAREGIHCDLPGRAPASPEVSAIVRRALRQAGRCDNTEANPCSSYVLCTMTPAEGEDLERCLTSPPSDLGRDAVGYCFLDASSDRDGDGRARCEYDREHPEAWRDEPDCVGNPLLVDSCPTAQRRNFRFPSQRLEVPVPFENSVVAIACQVQVERE